MREVKGRRFRVWQSAGGGWYAAELDTLDFMLQMSGRCDTEREADAVVAAWTAQPEGVE